MINSSAASDALTCPTCRERGQREGEGGREGLGSKGRDGSGRRQSVKRCSGPSPSVEAVTALATAYPSCGSGRNSWDPFKSAAIRHENLTLIRT
jgi:hypothetical protein